MSDILKPTQFAIHPIQHNPPAGVDITFKDLKYSVQTKKGEKYLLKGVSGICKSSSVNAILGASGAGKTTLLNVLCQRIKNSKKTKLEGEILANKNPYDSHEFSQFAAYVMQDDILLETMTVKECFQFAANLKTSGTQQDKELKVQDMIRSLKLERCQNTFIGGHFVKGISGGEKKRTSIGYELISDPACIFLDEPTSGLDSFTAYTIIHLLADYAHQKNKTVTFTIHQPSSDIWNLFDNIMLMIEGQLIYQGDGKNAIIEHFASIGFQCPLKSNPSDYFMSIMHASSETNLTNYQKYYDGYNQNIKAIVQSNIEKTNDGELPKKQSKTGMLYQISQLAERQVKILRRNPILSKAKLMQTIFLSIFIGLVYLDLPGPDDSPTQRDVNDKNGFLFLFSVSVFMMSLNPCILTFPSQRAVFLREENAKLYNVFTYFFGKFIVDIVPTIVFPVISSLIVYWMVGLNDESSSKVLTFLLINILMSLTGLGIGYCGGSAFSEARVAISITPLLMMPFMLFAGFYKNAGDYASWIGWVQYLSPFKYSLSALIQNEYDYQGKGYPQDPVNQLNFDMSLSESLYGLLAVFLITTSLSYVLLRILKSRVQ